MNRRAFFSVLVGGSAAAGVGVALAKVPEPSVPAVPNNPGLVPFAPLPEVNVEWFGDTGEGQTVESVLSSRHWVYDRPDMFASIAEEQRLDLAFYHGTQWPETIEWERQKAARPCLTINRLPGIVSRVLDNSRVAGENFNHRDIEAVILEITRRNRDAQRAYNYLVSMKVERENLRIPKFVTKGWSTGPVLKDGDLFMIDGKEYVAKVQIGQRVV